MTMTGKAGKSALASTMAAEKSMKKEEKKDEKKESGLASPTSISMQNSFII